MGKFCWKILLGLWLAVLSGNAFGGSTGITEFVDLGPVYNCSVFADPQAYRQATGDGLVMGSLGNIYFPDNGFNNQGCFIPLTLTAITIPLTFYATSQEINSKVSSNPPALFRDSQGYPNVVMVHFPALYMTQMVAVQTPTPVPMPTPPPTRTPVGNIRLPGYLMESDETPPSPGNLTLTALQPNILPNAAGLTLTAGGLTLTASTLAGGVTITAVSTGSKYNAVRLTDKDFKLNFETPVDTIILLLAAEGQPGQKQGTNLPLKITCIYDDDIDQTGIGQVPLALGPAAATSLTLTSSIFSEGHECLASFPVVRDSGDIVPSTISWYAYAIHPDRLKNLKQLVLNCPGSGGTAGSVLLGAVSYKRTPNPELVLNAPASIESYTPFLVTVTAMDGYGFVDTGYRGIVHFATTDPFFITVTADTATPMPTPSEEFMAAGVTPAALPADYTFKPEQKGQAVIPVSLASTGSFTLSAQDTKNAKQTATVPVATAKNKLLAILADRRLSSINLCLLPTAYLGQYKHDSGWGFTNSYAFSWYIGNIYYVEGGQTNYTQPLGTYLLTGDLKAGMLGETDWSPALAGGVSGGFLFVSGSNPGQAQSLSQFSTNSLLNFFTVGSKKVWNGAVHAGFVWGNFPGFMATLSPYVLSTPDQLTADTQTGLTGSANLDQAPKHAVYVGFNYPLFGELSLKTEVVYPYELGNVYLINTQISHFTSFDLSYLRHKNGFQLMGYVNIRVQFYPSD